jgi:hypothetical protein
VGHRALVAVEIEGARYDVYRSQWGGSALTDPAESVRFVVTAAAETDPVAAALDAGGVLDALDPLVHEALFVAGRDGAVEAFLVVRVGFVPAEDRPPPDGTAAAALVPVTDAEGVPVTDPERARRLRRFVRETREGLGVAVDAGVLDSSVAARALRTRLASHPDVPPETVWIPASGGPEGGSR